MFVPAPKSVGCLSFEDHLVDSIFTTGEGTVHALQMEHDERHLYNSINFICHDIW